MAINGDDAHYNMCLSSASFWSPHYLSRSAWIQHAPFAFWLIAAARPSTIVELGTHTGVSYFAFCQAVVTEGLPTRCYAVDTWRGDDHTLPYGETIFARVQTHNAAHYAGFSKLLHRTFREALADIEDGTVDLLHVDGRHYYEDVREDFTSWEKKLSPRAVVLFHDTNVFERQFGVYRYWAEVRAGRPSFEFLHGHGLGVLGYGTDLPPLVSRFFASAADPTTTTAIRGAYERLGEGVQLAAKLDAIREDLAMRPTERLDVWMRSKLGIKPKKLKAGGWIL
ncbi:MAG: class I SAM-dependent methyltransferase [Hyphomicrobium sp.]